MARKKAQQPDVPARVLVATNIDGTPYPCNALVIFPAALRSDLEEAGIIDSNDDAVRYVMENGGRVITHGEKE